MPRVTVCIPTYDRPRWLGGAIESVIAQSYGDWVLEVHDDATPGTVVRDIVDRYDDPRVVYVGHERNVGIVGNFNRSLLGARTEFVVQVGDDDELRPEMLALTVAALDRHPRAGVAHGRFDLIDAGGGLLRAAADWTGDGGNPPLEPGADFLAASMRYGCRICSTTALIRRAAVPEGGFREADHPPFDLAFWLRMAHGWDVAFLPQALCRYRIHAESHSSGVAGMEQDGYVQRRAALETVHRVKLEAAAGDPRLLRAARRGHARDLLADARTRTLPERRLRPTAAALAGAAREEPALALDPRAWGTLAASVLGRRVYGRLRRQPRVERSTPNASA